MNQKLKEYVEADILPRYTHFDKAHQLDHITTVIEQSAALADMLQAQGVEVDRNMVYVIAAYHDLGIVNGRENHHIDSGKILMADPQLPEYFTPEQLRTMKEAVEDHRASAKSAPRSLYGRIVAEADRQIDPRTIVLRTLQYGLEHYPELDKAGHFARAEAHLKEKYGEGGYLKLWFAESENAHRLAELRAMMADREQMHALLEDIWRSEAGGTEQ
ncbi:MAG: HD domain-containing protein [Bacteroidales bacterium]|nr:HD domain-containing protein [Bacteroidales bacterium]